MKCRWLKHSPFFSTTSLSNSRRSRTDIERLHFRYVNERVVNDITLEFLYKPHTLSVLGLLGVYLLYHAFWV